MRLYIRCRGPIGSAAFVDRELADLKALPAPWRYDRIVDRSRCTGFIDYADLERLSSFWQSIRSRMDRTVRVAMITTNPLTVARLAVVSQAFPHHVVRAFPDVACGEKWLAQ